MTSLVLGPDSEGAFLVARDGIVERFGIEQITTADVDCSGGLIVPGAVNAHTHLYSGLAPLGMPAPEEEPRNFIEILEQVWWRLDRALDAHSLRAAARLYAAEALLAGCLPNVGSVTGIPGAHHHLPVSQPVALIAALRVLLEPKTG